MQFTLTIDLGNDAMQTRADIESALRKLGQNCRYMSDPPEAGDDGAIMDDNGNKVGRWEVTETVADALEVVAWPLRGPSVPRVEYVKEGERGSMINTWCVAWDGKLYPFGDGDESREACERNAADWHPERYTWLGWNQPERTVG
jgi:hypothetical protein